MVLRMPRLVADQRATFNSNELFRRLSRESEIRYTGFKEMDDEERRAKFYTNCKSGRVQIAFVNSGTNFVLHFFPINNDSKHVSNSPPSNEYVNFDKEPGKVFLKSPFILNGVCVCWKGWVSLLHLDGMGHIEFDEERAVVEASLLPETSNLQLSKISNQKVHAQKHIASEKGSNLFDKRPRFV